MTVSIERDFEPKMTNREHLKVVLLGDSSTGKTCLMKRYFLGQFNREEVSVSYFCIRVILRLHKFQLCETILKIVRGFCVITLVDLI